MQISEAYHGPPRALGLTVVLSPTVQLARPKSCAGLSENPRFSVRSGVGVLQPPAAMTACRSGLLLYAAKLSESTMSPPRPHFLGAAPARDQAWWVHEALPVRQEHLHWETLTGGSAVPQDTASNYWNSISKIYCFLTSRHVELYWKDKSLENNT